MATSLAAGRSRLGSYPPTERRAGGRTALRPAWIADILVTQVVAGEVSGRVMSEPFLNFLASSLICGRSSVAEHQLPKLSVEGSIPFARSNIK